MDDIRSDDWKRVVQELRRELFGGKGCPTDPDLPLVPFILTVTKKGEHIPMCAYDRTVAFMKVAVEKGAVSLEKGTSNKGKQSRHAHLVGIMHIERDDRMKTIVTDAYKAFFPIRCATYTTCTINYSLLLDRKNDGFNVHFKFLEFGQTFLAEIGYILKDEATEHFKCAAFNLTPEDLQHAREAYDSVKADFMSGKTALTRPNIMKFAHREYTKEIWPLTKPSFARMLQYMVNKKVYYPEPGDIQLCVYC
jgi:hypothetical protein